MKAVVGILSFGVMLGIGAAVKWIFEADMHFGFGMGFGVALMIGLYWLAEWIGVRETHY